MTFSKLIGLVAVLALGLGAYFYFDGRRAAPEYEAGGAPVVTNNQSATSTMSDNIPVPTSVTMVTNKGTIEIELLPATAPKTSDNFAKLAAAGFYDGTRFHRVIKGFMIQGGDPLSKDVSARARWGTGGPGYQFEDELSGKEQYLQGTLAMANSGPDTNGSQFFIVTAAPGYPLPPSYTVFGKVTKGLEVALAIENVKTNPANDQPTEDVIVQSVSVR